MPGRQKDQIFVRISLQGAKEIKDQLRDLGKAGEDAFKELDQAVKAVEVEGTFVRIRNRINDIISLGGRIPVTIGSAIRGLTLAVAALQTAATGAAGAMVALAASVSNQAREIQKQAAIVGITTQAFERLRTVGSAVGTGIETLTRTFFQLSGRILEASGDTDSSNDIFSRAGVVYKRTAQGAALLAKELGIVVQNSKLVGFDKVKKSTDDVVQAFREFGIEVKNTDGTLKNAEQLLFELAAAYEKVEDPVRRNALLNRILKDEGRELIPILALGADKLRELAQRAAEVDPPFTEAELQTAARFQASLTFLQAALRDIGQVIGVEIQPVLTKAFDELSDAAIENRENVRSIGGVLADLLSIYVNVQSTLIDGWRAVGSAISGAFEAITGAELSNTFTDFVNSQKVVFRKFGELFAFENVKTSITDFVNFVSDSFKRLFEVFETPDATVGFFQSLLGQFASFNQGLTATLSSILANIGQWISDLAGLFAPPKFITDFFKAIGDGLSDAAKRIGEGLAAIIAKVQSPAPFVAAARAIWQTFVDAFNAQTSPDFLVNFFKGAFDKVIETAREFWKNLTSLFSAEQATVNKTFDQLPVASASAFEAVLRGATLFSGRLGIALNLAIPVVQRVWDAISKNGAGAFTQIADQAGSIVTRIRTALSPVTSLVSSAFQGAAKAIAGLFNSALAEGRKAASQIRDALKQATEIAGDIEGASKLAAALVKPFDDAKDAIQTILNSLQGIVQSSLDGVVDAAERALSRLRGVVEDILRLLERARRAAAEIERLGNASSDDAEGFSGGGHIRGPGTSTSDSIPAWLSAGEFVMRARAVQKYGVNFMRLINSGQLKLPELKFARGGLIPTLKLPSLDGIGHALADAMAIPLPRLATGGVPELQAVTGSGRTLNLSIDGETFGGLFAPESTAERLERFAMSRRLARSGRRPKWQEGL